MSTAKKQVINRHLEAAVRSFRAAWNDDFILGDAKAYVYSVAVPYAGVRSSGAKVTNFGSFFYHGKKTGKSNYTDSVFQHGEELEVDVNDAARRLIHNPPAQADAVPSDPPTTTNIIFKNVGPEEMMAQADPNKFGRGWWSAIRAEAEFGSHCEQVNLLGSGGAQKKYENQAGYNDLFDDGMASKLYRDASKNYGKDVFANWKRRVLQRQEVRTMGFYHTGRMNFHDAHKLLCEAEGHHSMALLDRYCAMPLIPENPYADPPDGFDPPEVVKKADGELQRDAHGLWRRDKLPAPRKEVLDGMRAVKDFVESNPNAVARFTPKGAALYRLVDSVNWSAADRLQYVDEDKAARLRQLQRFLYDFAIAQLLLEVQKAASGPAGPAGDAADAGAAAAPGAVATRPTVKDTFVDEQHVQRAVCHLAAIWEGHESFVNPRRTMYLEENVWRGTLVEQREAAARAAADEGADDVEAEGVAGAESGLELPAGWSQNAWNGTPYYYPDADERAWQYEHPSTVPTPPVPRIPQGVDEYVSVGIIDAGLKSRMIAGVDDAEVTWGGGDLIAAACKNTLLWKCPTAENRITGNVVSAAIRASQVAWPSLSWWKSVVVEGELLRAGLGRKSDHNAGGGFWEKPKVPIDEEELTAFVDQLAQWGVALEDYERAWVTGAAASGAAPARRPARAPARAAAPGERTFLLRIAPVSPPGPSTRQSTPELGFRVEYRASCDGGEQERDAAARLVREVFPGAEVETECIGGGIGRPCDCPSSPSAGAARRR
ncbi:unnamed protein product [Prorocentrum cordatum]|uniref:WW domain-containing protein n=1 Tax=Prorocentrum cordatum TaxID=2364126 RepID=A0ABN9UUA9_9DINO|nr:unnamed protein product [Polarella glacialis]